VISGGGKITNVDAIQIQGTDSCAGKTRNFAKVCEASEITFNRAEA